MVSPSPASRIPFLLVLLAAMLVRGGVLWLRQGELSSDPDAYREIATNVVHLQGFSRGQPPHPTAFRPPLYPLLLASIAWPDGVVSNLTVAWLHWVLGVATVALTWVLAKDLLTKNQLTEADINAPLAPWTHWLAPAVAALLVACDPILLNQSSLVMTETLATFLATLALVCLTKAERLVTSVPNRYFWQVVLPPIWQWWLCAALSLGLAALCRPSLLPWMVLVLGTVLVSPRPTINIWHRFAPAGLLALGFLLLSPWGARNHQLFGRTILTTTHGGYTLFLGNNPLFYQHLLHDKTGLPWDSKPLDEMLAREPLAENFSGSLDADEIKQALAQELQADRECSAAAWQLMQRQPFMAGYASLYRLAQFWSPLPHQISADESEGRSAARYAVAVWYLAVYGLGLAGIWQLGWRLLQAPWLYSLLLVLVLAGMHSLYWSNLRMRAPIMPVVAILAAAGAARAVFGQLEARLPSRSPSAKP